jgi:SpoU rRNA methylase family enzyme
MIGLRMFKTLSSTLKVLDFFKLIFSVGLRLSLVIIGTLGSAQESGGL